MAKEAADAEAKKEARRRKERRNRDAFSALVQEHLASGRLSAKTRFRVRPPSSYPPSPACGRLLRTAHNSSWERKEIASPLVRLFLFVYYILLCSLCSFSVWLPSSFCTWRVMAWREAACRSTWPC